MSEEHLLYTNMAERADYLELIRLLDQVPVPRSECRWVVTSSSEPSERRPPAASAALIWPTHGKLGMQIVFVADGASREERVQQRFTRRPKPATQSCSR